MESNSDANLSTAFVEARDALLAELEELRQGGDDVYADFCLDTINQFLANEQSFTGEERIRLYHALHENHHLTDDQWGHFVSVLLGLPLDASPDQYPNWVQSLTAFLPPSIGSRFAGQLKKKMAEDYDGKLALDRIEAICKEHLDLINNLQAESEVKVDYLNEEYRLFADACSRSGHRYVGVLKLSKQLFASDAANHVITIFKAAAATRSPVQPMGRSVGPDQQHSLPSREGLASTMPLPSTSTLDTSVNKTHATSLSRDSINSPSTANSARPVDKTTTLILTGAGEHGQAVSPIDPQVATVTPKSGQTKDEAFKPSVSGTVPGPQQPDVQQYRGQPLMRSTESAPVGEARKVILTPTALIPRSTGVKEIDVGDIDHRSTATASNTHLLAVPRPSVPLGRLRDDQDLHHFYLLLPFRYNKEDNQPFQVRLVGSSPVVGSWEPESGIPLASGHNPYVYHCSLAISRLEPGFEYKYVLVFENGDTVWEKANNRWVYPKLVHFDSVTGFEASLLGAARSILHIGHGDWRKVEIDFQIAYLIEIIFCLPDEHTADSYQQFYRHGYELLVHSPPSGQRVTDIVRNVQEFVRRIEDRRKLAILFYLLALIVRNRPNYREPIPEELLSLLTPACAVIFGATHLYHREDLNNFFTDLCYIVSHLLAEHDVQWVVYIPLVNVISRALSRSPPYIGHLVNSSRSVVYRRNVSEDRYRKLLIQLMPLWGYNSRVSHPSINLKAVLLQFAGSLNALNALATFLTKIEATNRAPWEPQFKADLLAAIFEHLQPENLSVAQEIPLRQEDGTCVRAGSDPDFQTRLNARLYKLISNSSNAQLSSQLLASVPSELLTFELLERVLSLTAGSLPDMVILLEPFAAREGLREDVERNDILDRFNQALGQSRSLPIQEFMQAIDRLLRLRLFPVERVLEFVKSFLHGLLPQKALDWLCTQRRHQFDSDLDLALDSFAKETLAPQLLEAVGGLHSALKHLKRTIASPSVNPTLALDVLRFLCDRGLPQLGTTSTMLTNAKLWRKFAQVMQLAVNHKLIASQVLQGQLGVLDKLRQSVASLCKSLSAKDITLHDLSQLSAQRKPFLRLCQVIGLSNVAADLDSCHRLEIDCRQKLAMLNVFLSRYCQSFDLQGGLAILAMAVSSLQDNLEASRLADIQQQLLVHWVPDMAHTLQCLYQLRSNELFLGLWNQTALNLESESGNTPGESAASQSTSAPLVDSLNVKEGENISWDWDLDEEDAEDDSEQNDAQESVTPRQEDTGANTAPVRLTFSSPTEVNDKLITIVLRKCRTLGLEIANGTIATVQLSRLISGKDFSPLINGLSEIIAVVQEPDTALPTVAPDQLEAALSVLKHAMLLHRFVSSFLVFLSTLDWSLEDADDLATWAQSMDRCMNSGHLAELEHHLKDEVLNTFLGRLPFNDLVTQSQPLDILGEFFAIVAQGIDFIAQLREFKDKNELRAVIDLCKGNTDKESELQALANFRDAANIIYTFDDTPANDKLHTLRWEKFLEALDNLQIGERTIRLFTDINAQMPELRRVFADAYKGSSTRAIADLYDLIDNSYFCFVPPSTNSRTMHIKQVASQCFYAAVPMPLAQKDEASSSENLESALRQPDEKIRSLEWLEELRNRLMLATDLGSKDTEAIDWFLEVLVLLKEINDSRIALFFSGHPEFQAFNERLKANESKLEQLARVKEQMTLKLSQWTTTVDALREQHYFLNFFTIHQLLTIVALLQQYCDPVKPLPDELVHFFQFVKLDIDPEDARARLSAFTQERSFSLVDDEKRTSASEQYLADTLALIGEAFSFVFKGNCECHRPWGSVIGTNPGDFTSGEPNVIVAANRSRVLVHALSLYAQLCQRLPEAEEVLICSPTTTREQIRLIMLRCLGAESAQRESRLYCLVHIEQLSFELQNYTTLLHAQLSTALRQKGQGVLRYRLAIISGEAEGQEAVTAWSSFVRQHLDPVPTVDICAALANYFQSRAIHVHAYSSEFAGMGKTHSIKSWCRERAGVEPRVVPIYGQMSTSELASLLTTQDKPVYHFDLSPGVGPELNTLLFELLVLGAVQQPDGRMLYWPRDSTLAIEVPNSIANSTRKRLHFLDYLPGTLLREASNPIIVTHEAQDAPALLIASYQVDTETVHHNRVQYVCKFLQAYSAGTLPNIDVHPHTIPDLTYDECMKLLEKYCRDWSHLTLVLRMNFVLYFFQQLRAFEDSSFFLKDTLQPEALILRQAVVEWLIDTTADFASSSMDPKQSTTYDLSETFKLSRRWGERRQPYLIFNSNGGGSISPLWMEPEKAANIEHVRLLRSMSCFQCSSGKAHACTAVPRLADFSENLGRHLLSILFGVPESRIEEAMHAEGKAEYVLTLDNFLKIVAIHFRVKAHIPVVIMGETGCGKTRLIEFICACQAIPLIKRDVHGGVSLSELEGDVSCAIQTALDFPDLLVYLFFDEFNTKDAPGFFKAVVCDRRFKEVALPENLVVIAACNPYRKSISSSTAGLVYQYSDTTQQEELKQLAYIVHPLPEVMKQLVWDFGSLTSDAEVQYIRRLMERCTVSKFPGAYALFCQAVHNSHEFMKENEKELRSLVSLRDVLRCITLYEWFMVDYLQHNRGGRNDEQTSIKAIILALAICYFFRLTKSLRKNYLRMIGTAFSNGRFQSVIIDEAKWILDNMDLPPGTAKNQALTENVFVLLVCIYNKIPVFLVGKPGSSKTLAMTLIRNNFGQRRKLNLPSIDITSHQCSPQSTSEGIRESYKRACRLSDPDGRVCGVLLLEEVGLAELSPHLPLKVLHSILDEGRVAVVGISNWALDPAKMNRAVHLDRPLPTVTDLETTVTQILAAQGDSRLVRNLLKPLALAYDDIYNHQRVKPDFYGLRDFYALVRDLHQSLQSRIKRRTISTNNDYEFEALRRAVSHNFNGQGGEEFTRMFDIFLRKTKISSSIAEKMKPPSPLTVIKENLSSDRVRHLMLLTKNDAALQVLLDFGIVTQANVKILFGSDYPNDQNDTYTCRMIQQIRMSMERGDTLILLHQDNLYESLYDLLNQNYMHVGNCKYCWIALGAHSRQCMVHDNFKCIVIVDRDRALLPSGLPPPFLNRFVKLTLVPSDLINRYNAASIVDHINKWLATCAAPLPADQAFTGYHDGYAQSLVVAVIGQLRSRIDSSKPQSKPKADQVLRKAKKWALLTATLETGMRLGDNRTDVPDAKALYETYRKQPHLNLTQLMGFAKQRRWDEDGGGLQLVVITHSTRLHQIERAFGEENVPRVRLVHLMNLTSEHELTSILDGFWSERDGDRQCERDDSREDDDERFLLVTAHAPGCSDDRLSHFKFLCSRARARFVQLQHRSALRHVVVLRFLPRSAPAPTSGGQTQQRKQSSSTSLRQNLFKLDFERQFRHVYLDNVLSGNETGEPEIEHMLDKSISDVLRQDHISQAVLPDLIRREYRRVLNRLRFVSKADVDDKSHAKMIQMMERILQCKEFVSGLVAQLIHATHDDGDNGPGAVNWQSKLVRENASSREGSLRAAFYQYFVASITRQLSWLLAQIGANGNLLLLDSTLMAGSNHPVAKVWLQLLATPGLWSFDAVGATVAKGAAGSVMTVEHQIKASFPFSSTIIEAVGLLRQDAAATAEVREAELNDPLAAVGESLQQLIANGKLRAVSNLDRQLVGRYVSDFTELMVLRGGISSENQHLTTVAKHILQSLLQAAMNQSGLEFQIGSVHAAYWAVEGFVKGLFILMNVLGSKDSLFNDLGQFDIEGEKPVTRLQLALLRTLITSLDLPRAEDAGGLDLSIRKWAVQYADLRSGIQSLLDLLATDLTNRGVADATEKRDVGADEDEAADAEDAELTNELAQLVHDWTLVRLRADFYHIVAIPLQLPAASIAAFDSCISECVATAQRLASRDEFKRVLDFLRKNVAVTGDPAYHWQQMSRFAEELILIAFLPAILAHSKEQALSLDFLVRALFDKSDIFIPAPKEDNMAHGGLWLTSAAKRAVIKALLSLYDKVATWNSSATRRLLDSQFTAIATAKVEANGTSADDEPFNVLYSECFEDWLEANTSQLLHRLRGEAISAASWLQHNSVIDRLQAIALLRLIMRRLATELHSAVLHPDDKLDPTREQERNYIIEAANDIVPVASKLGDTLPLSQPLLHLVRELAQKCGLQIAKVVVCGPQAQALLPWLKVADIERLLIVGRGRVSDRIPSVDAFELLDLEGYSLLRDAVQATVQVGEAAGLKNKLPDATVPYALFPALYKEVAVAHAEGRQRELAKGLDWLNKFLNQYYAAFPNWARLASCYVKNEWSLARWHLDEQTTYDTMANLGLLSHIAALIVRLGSQATPLHQLLFAPKSQTACFLPTMPDDPRQRIAREYMQKPGGFTYLGTCNHVYYVPPCGLPMSIESCGVDGCASKIGGQSHVPLPGHVLLMVAGIQPNTRGFNVAMRDVGELTDQTPKGYAPLTLLENAAYRIRDCSPMAFWILRLLVDGALLLSCMSNFEGRSRADALALAGMPDNDHSQAYYEDRFTQSLSQVAELMAVNKEDALLLIHWALDSLASTAPLEGDYSALDSLPKRQQWEQWACTALAAITDPVQSSDKLRELKIRLQEGAGVEQKQVLEAVTETVDPELVSGTKDNGTYRSSNRPALWRTRVAVTLDDLRHRFLSDGQALAECPTLALLLSEEELLQCIAALPNILAWKAAVDQHFNKRIDKQTAESRNIGRVLQELPPELRRQWTTLFENFADGWNRARAYIRSHDAEKGLNLIEMTDRAPLIYSLNMLVAEGAQGVTLIRWLIAKHNDIIVRLHRTLGAEPEHDELDAAAADAAYLAKLRRFGEVPLHLVRSSHMVQPIPTHGRMEHVLQLSANKSYLYGNGSRTSYDFKRIEEFVFAECVHGRPLIDPNPVQIRMVSFLNETGLNNLLRQIEGVVSPQSELSEEILQRMRQELHPVELAQRCLRAVEMCMNFLRTSGGDPRQTLVEYAQEVLLVDCRDETRGLHFGFLSDRHGDAVCLTHVNALWRQLHKIVFPDPFGALAAKYREKLKPNLQAKFKKYCSALRKETRALVANTLEIYVRENLLEEETIKPDAGAKEYIEKLLTNNDWRQALDMEPLELAELTELSVNMALFPPDLKIQHCYEASRLARQLAAKP